MTNNATNSECDDADEAAIQMLPGPGSTTTMPATTTTTTEPATTTTVQAK